MHALLFSLTLLSGHPQVESHYDALCVSPKAHVWRKYDCTLHNKDFTKDPQTCKNFDLKEIHEADGRKFRAQARVTCKHYTDGSLDLELRLENAPSNLPDQVRSTTGILEPQIIFDEEELNDVPDAQPDAETITPQAIESGDEA